MDQLLAIDIGNSNFKYGLFIDGDLKETWRHPTGEVKEKAPAILATSNCALSNCKIAISSVVPAAEKHLRELLGSRTVISVSEVSQKLLTGMNPAMGADRVADAVAAWKIYGRQRTPVAVIGLGTATTILVISGSGHVKGGWINPGLGVTLETLHHRTALLPLLKMEGQTLDLGHDTDTHMRNGVFTGHIGLVREWLAVAKCNLYGKALTVGTGGWSGSINDFGAVFDVCDPHLTLKGIYILATSAEVAPQPASDRQVALAKKRFARLMKTLAVNEEKWQPIWKNLERLYGERLRYYHNFKHINKVLDWLESFMGSTSAMLYLAAFYHDAIYDTRLHDNEEQSAALARADLATLGLPEQLGVDVSAIICATKGHRPLSGNLARDSRLFLDADLSILGASAGEYGLYAANIALEYDWFEPAAYKKGRANVLKRFLERKQIFYSPQARALLEKKAKSNLERELARMNAEKG